MRTNWLKSRYLELLSKITLSIVVLAISGIGFSIYLQYVVCSSNTENLNKDQQGVINDVLNDICLVDSNFCGIKNINYKVFIYPEWLRPILSQSISFYAEANKRVNGHEIKISPFLMENRQALIVYLYHELNHVKRSDFSLYIDGNDQLICIDHNQVKLATQKLPKMMIGNNKYDISAITEYTNYTGNTIIKCTGAK